VCVGGWPLWATLVLILFAAIALATFIVAVVMLALSRRHRRQDAVVALHIREDLLGPNDTIVVEV